MDRRRFVALVGGTGVAISLSGCLAWVTSDDGADSEQGTDEYDAEPIEPDESVPIDESDRAAETNVEQLLIVGSSVEGNPDGQTVGVEYVVQNTAPETRSAVLVATLDITDGETYEKRGAVSLPVDTVHTYSFEHETEESVPADELDYHASATLGR